MQTLRFNELKISYQTTKITTYQSAKSRTKQDVIVAFYKKLIFTPNRSQKENARKINSWYQHRNIFKKCYIQLRATSGYVTKAGFCWSPQMKTEIKPLLVFTQTSCNVKVPKQKLFQNPSIIFSRFCNNIKL